VLGGITERWQFFLGLMLLAVVLFARGGLVGLLAGEGAPWLSRSSRSAACRKSFGALKATDDVRPRPAPGEIHALIGPNGAGKSTLINQIAGTLRPTPATIRFLGRDIVTASTWPPRAARARAHLPGLLAGARVLGAAQRHAGGAGAAGIELPLLPPVMRDPR
jgi:hypothetical protein